MSTIGAPPVDAALGEPDDVADVIVFLASDQARWVTGQKLYVGGGLKMPLSTADLGSTFDRDPLDLRSSWHQ